MSSIDVLLGLQWGDEGKGKLVDVLAPQYDIVARFQGGPNAGHTIVIEDTKYVLHLIPSGIFHDGIKCVIGNGVVLDPIVLRREIEHLEHAGISVRDKLIISHRAHLILPSHKLLDAASEAAKGEAKIGSTLRGIGPTYMDKTGRNGLRMGDLTSPHFQDRYNQLVEKHKRMLDSLYQYEYELEEKTAQFKEAVEFLKEFSIIDTSAYLHEELAAGKRILAEGAQGTLLDIEFGSYPFVTSSHTTTSGACIGLGIAPNKIGRVYGIFKAYCTRVGSGPFPTELHDEMGAKLRQAGAEFGATTGRPRRCGWLDLPLLHYAIRINGVTDLIMTKADVLSAVDHIKVCTAYKNDKGGLTNEIPFDISAGIDPIYETRESWAEDVSRIQTKEALPDQLRTYVSYLESELKVPVTYLSIGPEREQIMSMGTMTV